jgi:ACS family tartrate transporter-like MFS transporter
VHRSLAGVILQLNGWHGIPGWQWLFLLEGLPAVALGAVSLVYLTDAPAEAKWLAPAEREWLAETMRAEHALTLERHGLGVREALLHPMVWRLGLIIFACQSGSYGLTLWIPQIVRQLSGLGDLATSLISAIPYAAASVGMILIGLSSDRSGERLLHIAVPSAIAAVAFAASAHLTSPVPGMLALTVAAVGDLSTRGPFWALPTRFLAGGAAAGGIALMNTLGSLGGFVGPYAVGLLRTLTHGFAAGLWLLALLLLAAAVGSLRLRGEPLLAEDARDPAR